MRASLVFMGTPSFAVPTLQRLVEAGYGVAAVYSQPDRPAGRGRRLAPPPVKLAALELGLPVRQPQSLRTPEAVEELAALKPEAIVVCAFGQILRPPVLAIPPKGVLNVHPSLLPRWRGASPIAAAILAADAATGVTIMLMDAGMDTGPILARRSLSIEERNSAATLASRLAHLAPDLLLETLPQWLEGNLVPQPQDDSEATYCPVLRKEDGAIDWRLPAVEVWRLVRAFNPWPGAFTLYRGGPLHIWDAWPVPSPGGPPPGTVLALAPEQEALLRRVSAEGGFGVQTGQGILAVLRVQRAGGRAMAAAEFLRGQRGFVGTVLSGS